ncbi:hypothetical protein F5X96DRAFT_657110 [Biscogniauxia mediterranea]|nr:hypothetical protein F5X96DRAFT_657110 [Biscogniauxia mediterranea]
MNSNRATKVSQRASLTCIPCAKSKVRCNKAIPCIRCIEQGRSHLCSREPTRLSTRRAVIEQAAELRVLQNIVKQLEQSNPEALLRSLKDRIEELSGTTQDGPKAVAAAALPVQTQQQPTSDSTALPGLPSKSQNQGEPEDLSHDHDGLALTLEYLAWGRNYYKHDDTVTKGKKGPSTHLKSTDLSEDGSANADIPHPHLARKLVVYHIQSLCWHHNAIHSPTFLDECESFWKTGSVVDPCWMALYYAVLSSAAWCYPHDDEFISSDELKSRAGMWYDAMVSVLNQNDFMENHSIYSVQSIVISILVAHPLGHSNAHYILLSAAIRIAQCLGLDKIKHKPRQESQSSPEEWESVVENEVKRRVWWQLIIQDYFAVPFVDTYSINPNHFSTPMPGNTDDHDLVDKPSHQPTISSYCIVLAKMAWLMPQLVDGAHRLSSTSPNKHYEHVLELDLKMRQLVSDIPPFLSRQTPIDPNWPPWVNWARQTLTISAADKLIMIHRAFLVQSFRSPVYAYTRTTCLSASLTILQEYLRIKSSAANVWVVPAFTISAAIIVALDLLFTAEPTSQTEKNRRLVSQTISGLSSTKQHKMAVRGASILTALLEEEQERRRHGVNAERNLLSDSFSSRVTRHLDGTSPEHGQSSERQKIPVGDGVTSDPNLNPAGTDLTNYFDPVRLDIDNDLELWLNQSMSWNLMDDFALDPLKNASFASGYGRDVFGQDPGTWNYPNYSG